MTDSPLDALKPIKDTKVDSVTGIAAIALTMALKYHGINTVQDGALYQQYKLEGKNMRELELAMVFETAKQIEQHLLTATDRIAKIITEAIIVAVDEKEDTK